MITFRQRGLVTLHNVSIVAGAVLWFLGLAFLVGYLPILQLSEDVNLTSYAAVIGIGMAISDRFLFRFAGRYFEITWVDASQIAFRQTASVAFAAFGLVFATKDAAISRLFLGHYLITLWAVLLVLNRKLPRWLAKIVFHQSRHVRTLLVGSGRRAEKLSGWFARKGHVGIEVVGLLSEERSDLAGLPPWLGQPAALAQVLSGRGINQVVWLELSENPARMTEVLETCQAAGCRLLLYNDFLEKLPVAVNSLIEDGHHFLTIQEEPLEDPANRALKRLFDIVLSLPVAIFILPPLCLWVWVMQRFQSPGPLFFARPRGGQNGKEFLMLKFRSMHVGKRDAVLEARQAKAGDPRIFPFGLFMRSTSLDEFPQFWNVLRGEMSLVGPRPHLPQHDVEFSAVARTYRTRQLVKPGVTGLAQIRGFRGEITDPELLQSRVKADVEYITRWTIWLDLQITVKTFWQVLRPPPTAR